jgi:CubicO group peptidase (beta-lactamase class C family)
VMATDTNVTTAKGAAFPVGAGWSLAVAENRYSLVDPEQQLHLTYIELDIASASAAIEQAWQNQPGQHALRETKRSVIPSAVFDEVVQVLYDTGKQAQLQIALARRKGNTVWVALLEGPEGAFDRRGAQMANTLEGLKVPGATEESFVGRSPRPLDAAKTKLLLEFAERARIALGVPGAAIGVVQNGKSVIEAGLGFNELGAVTPVTSHTQFMIGSTTKGLTTLLMAKAVDLHKFAWDSKVRAVYPQFKLGDEALAEKMEMRHLVCACTGIPRADIGLIFSPKSATPDESMASLARLSPTTAFGETFQYNNQLVAAAGFITAHTLYPNVPIGQAYNQALTEHVLVPLGMRESVLIADDIVGKPLVRAASSSHGRNVNGGVVVVPAAAEHMFSAVRPSGGLISTVHDMNQYLIEEMAEGVAASGQRVASRENVLRRRQPQIATSNGAAYGMGLETSKSFGLAVVSHGGAVLGQYSTYFYLPEQQLGITVLVNGTGGLGSLIRARLLELVFDGTPQAERTLAFRLEEQQKDVAELQTTLAPPESVEIARRLVGTYRAPPTIGGNVAELRIALHGAELEVRIGHLASRLAWHKQASATAAEVLVRERNLMLLDPPLAGAELAAAVNTAGVIQLSFAMNQESVTYTRMSE